MQRLADALQHLTVEAGTLLAREGEEADTAFFVESGELSALRGGVKVGVFGEGQCCGEGCLLAAEGPEAPLREVSILAETASRLLVVERATFLRLVAPPLAEGC